MASARPDFLSGWQGRSLQKLYPVAQQSDRVTLHIQIGVSEAGGVPALLKLAECATPGATAAAAAALGSLTAQNKAVQDAMLNADAAQILVGLLGSPAIKEAAAAAADERDAALAAAIASFGAGNLAAQEAVVQARGIPKLLALLKSPDTIVQQHSSAALLVRRSARHIWTYWVTANCKCCDKKDYAQLSPCVHGLSF